MKNIRFTYNGRGLSQGARMVLLLLVGMALSFEYAGAQVRKDFTQRTSSYTPDRKIYNIKGDFQLIGNTNLTLSSYRDDRNNSNYNMEYVDVDGDVNTLNSSSATFTFSDEGGVADPDCSTIIYAGLYWTGRAHEGGTSSPNAFTVGGSTNDRYRNSTFNGYTLSITTANNTSLGTNGRTATYTFTPSGGGNAVIFRFNSWRAGSNDSSYTGSVTVQVGSVPVTTLSGSITNNSDTNFTFTFDTPYVINTGAQTIYINSLRKRRIENSINDYYRASVTSGSGAKLMDKRKVKFKKEGGTYWTVTADPSDIYYPTNSDDYMYSAYADVTDYVRANKQGVYFVADIALQEGDGGSVGYYGGWGLIVVYENSKMKWRDVTVFDGYAYVSSSAGTQELSISGFNTAQQGPVGVKLGLMAGEGDVGISGDRFSIRNAADNGWVNLSHGGNSTDNFFNSSIYTGGNNRNPNLRNNTGLDISMFTLPNDNKSLMRNNQTSTRFQYISTQDTYIIFCIAMAVDAYTPEVPAENNVITINGVPYVHGVSSTEVKPNDEIAYTVHLKNLGTEAVRDGKIVIPVPFTTTFMDASAEYYWQGTPAMSNTQPTYDSSLGGTGSIVWDIGYIPLPADKDMTLAKMTYRLKVTDDCFILNNSTCITVSVDGTTTGTGVTSGASFTRNNFVTGFIQEGPCNDTPVSVPVNFTIDATSYLETVCTVPEGEDPDYYTRRKFKYCGLPAGGTIPFTDVSPNFPKGSKFYNKIVVDPETEIVTPADDAIQYTSSHGFPVGNFGMPVTYYVIPPGLDITCYWEFIIIVDQYCSNYWHGTESTNWATANNWTAKRVPDAGENIEFATRENNKNNPAQNDLYLDIDRIIGDLVNASDKNLVITTGNQLAINGTVTDGNATAGTIIVKSSPTEPTGTLKFADPEKNKNVKATVEFYNKAYECDNCGFYRKQWQYFGIPVDQSVLFPATGNETVNQWSEPTNGNKWITPTSPLQAFRGYQITNKENTPPTHIYEFKGTLKVGDASVLLTRTPDVNYSGANLVGNSYAAAIPISEAALKFPIGVEATVYLFNTGTRDQWRKLDGTTVNHQDGYRSGQYLGVPLNVAHTNEHLPDKIPSMHAFMVLAEPGTGNIDPLEIKYSTLVKNTAVKSGASGGGTIVTRSAGSEGTVASALILPSLTIDVIGEQSADRVWIFTKEGTTHGFDNGWDGRKMEESGIVQLYVAGSDNSKLQVATVPDINNVSLGFMADTDGKYTFDFSLRGTLKGADLFLYDVVTGTTERISDGNSYTFEAKKGESATRFRLAYTGNSTFLSTDEALIDVMATEEGKIKVVNGSGRACSVFVSGAHGAHSQRVEAAANSETEISVPGNGTYMIRLQNAVVNDVRRIVIGNK